MKHHAENILEDVQLVGRMRNTLYKKGGDMLIVFIVYFVLMIVI